MSWLKHASDKKSLPERKRRRCHSVPMVEPLDNRVMMAVTASFSAAQEVLTVTGDAQDNSIAIAFNAAGSIVVNGGAVPVQGGTPTATNTRLIQIFGLGGNDDLTWARSLNLPAGRIDGGAGNDTITSGTRDDVLIGGAGDDTYRFDTDAALGRDVIDESGGGIDTLDFSSTTTRAVNIDLSNPGQVVNFSPTTTTRAGSIALSNPGDQVVNANLTLNLSAGNTIENVIGGALGDTLIGNSLNNVFEGGGGNDILGGGDLDVASGAGNDTYRFDTDNALGTDSII